MASVQGPSSSHLRLFVDRQSNKVVVAEASGDFIDALLSFLTLPLGTIIRLLSNKQTHRSSAYVGCINNLYQSVQNFDTEVFWNGICKKMLLCPRNPCEKLCQKLRFNVDDTEPTKYLMCGSCRQGSDKWLSTFSGVGCSCGKLMDQGTKVVEEEDNNPKGGVFVRGESMYLIFDDLTVLQNSACNTIHQLVQLGYSDFTKLTEISPTVGLNQIIELLRRALVSTSPLTDVFLTPEAARSKPMSSFTPRPASQNVKKTQSSCNLKITVSKSKNKILFAEADEDFADFLFGFLTMPLGSTLKLLDGNVNLGSMHGLYKSVKALNPSWFGRYRYPHSPFSPLLDLKVASQYGCKKQRLDVHEEESPCYYYGIGIGRNNATYGSHNEVISNDRGKIKNASKVELFDPRCADGRKEAVGFVRRPALLAVTDDLQLKSLASTSSISFLQKLKVPLNDLEQHEVTIHKTEALNLLGASLTSKAALTNGLFYLVKKQKEEPTI
ncbi:uncharacterized protein LOC114739618 [Neltuma alba]|uniref:uncharacterized protein LOC114739618 n=1 Tax=Neltuma alba TaxID=207710 RepID=UPI0010A33BE0|nr:uncharacterized protein LOC114739618 [Prosopis alba]